MNEQTLVSVHGYSGDAGQVQMLLPYYVHHRCPVVIVSPVDAPITPALLKHPVGIHYKFAGQRAYTGDVSMERQKQQMQLLLREFPHRYFLMNDSDSVCVSPDIPQYLYREPDVFWATQSSDLMHVRPADWPYPRVAFQPPYFCSRFVLEQMIKAMDVVTYDSIDMKFIDHYLMRLAVQGGVKHKPFPVSVSCPTYGTESAAGLAHLRDYVSRLGAVMLHAIKTPEAIAAALEARQQYLRGVH